jgi:hypothetical protein
MKGPFSPSSWELRTGIGKLSGLGSRSINPGSYVASLLCSFLNICLILISADQIPLFIQNFCSSVILACTWLFRGHKMDSGHGAEWQLPATNTNSHRAKATLIPRKKDWLLSACVRHTWLFRSTMVEGLQCIVGNFPLFCDQKLGLFFPCGFAFSETSLTSAFSQERSECGEVSYTLRSLAQKW